MPYQGMKFWLIQVVISVLVGLYFGIRTYRKQDAQYREVLMGVCEDFITENKQRFQEWFDQVIYFSEEEREICRQ